MPGPGFCDDEVFFFGTENDKKIHPILSSGDATVNESRLERLKDSELKLQNTLPSSDIKLAT